MATLKFNSLYKAIKGAQELPAGKYNMSIQVFRNSNKRDNSDIQYIFDLAMKIINKLPENVVIISIDNSKYLKGDNGNCEIEFKKVVCEEHPDAW